MAEGTRKEFLAVAGIAGVSALTPAPLLAQSAPAPSASPAHAPSATARALAQRMRAFDSTLTGAQIDEIARGIDQSLATGKLLRPKHADLSVADSPSPQFRVGE